MRAGRMDRTITLQRTVNPLEVDSTGNPVFAWENVATVRAEVVQASTEEFMRAFGASDEKAIVFRTRYVAAVTNADRISYEGRFYNIKEVKELGRREGLEIRAISTGGS